jgi:GNAT superfamily N-acetyltransferase
MTTIRPAQPADALAVARVHVRSWQAGYRGLLADDYLDGLRAEDRARRYDFANPDPRAPATLVAVEAGLIRGFATTTAPARAADLPDHGELSALYVDPDWWGRGVGEALLAAARQRLLRQGHGAALLWLLAGNARGERFYRRHGWAPDGARRGDTVWGVQVEELRYRV